MSTCNVSKVSEDAVRFLGGSLDGSFYEESHCSEFFLVCWTDFTFALWLILR